MLLAALLVLSAQLPDLGQIDFPTSGAPAAQEAFLRGALLLHSFEYADAAESFRAAQAADPGFALAYWGEALTHSHPIWQEDDRDAARSVLARLAPSAAERRAKAPNEKEKAYLDAVEALWGDGDRKARNDAYCDAMARMHERWPDDLEVASFYALAILGTATSGRHVPTYMRAAAVAEEVLLENPRHPGALHYAIHSYDDPVHAPLGVRMARIYGEVAPAAVHALHMPSHIWVALGMWDESASANEASFAAGDARVERKGLGIDERGWHSFWWLHYTYLQQGRYREARGLLASMESNTRQHASERTRAHLVRMRAEHLVCTGEEDVRAIDVALDELEPAVAAQHVVADGLAAAALGDAKSASAALERLRALAPGPRAAPDRSCCAAASYDKPGREAVAVMELELEGALRFASGDTDGALDLLRRAAEAEDASTSDFGPPVVVKPAHELLGDRLLELGRAEEAQRAFEQALDRAPRRARSLLGLARAAARAGDESRAAAAYAELAMIWHRADPKRPEVAEARRGAAGSARDG